MTENVPPGRPRRGRGDGAVRTGRAVPLLLVAGGLVLAAAALRPDGGLLGTPGDPPVGAIGYVGLIALGWAGIVGRFAARFREEVRPLVGPTPRVERLREAAVVLLGGAAVLVPVLLFLFHGRTQADNELPDPVVTPLPETTPTPTPEPEEGVAPTGDAGLLALLLYGLAAVVVVVLVVSLVRLLLGLYRSRRRPEPLPVVGRVEPEDALAAAVATGRRSLHGADARAAVIACYAAMEGSLADSGLERQVGDSPAELLERAVADDRVDRAPAYALTELFREARYSSHPMDDGHVRRARAALDTIAARLAEAGAEPADGAGRPLTDRAAASRSHR
ncbi:DUF4129 domain-containing protein [Kitasatospora sp. NPDC057500]|uniref:DUF4129 domain-containing protein n=1 Tax=Kitasatospora sp. NPDC057500 TaxID=3346151 RepID=UPI0036BD05CC